MKISSLRHKLRQANLLLLIKAAGGTTELAQKAKTPKSYISAMASGTRGVGDEMAARLEAIQGHPPGWMDRDNSSGSVPLSPAAMVLGEMLDRIPNERDKDTTAAICEHLCSMAKAGQLPRAIEGLLLFGIAIPPTTALPPDRTSQNDASPQART